MKLSLNDKMPFGKHKNKIIACVPIDYLNWAINTWKNITFDDKVLNLINSKSLLSKNEGPYTLKEEWIMIEKDNNDDYEPEENKYTDYQKLLIRQYKTCSDGPDIHEMRRNGLDYDDIWD